MELKNRLIDLGLNEKQANVYMLLSSQGEKRIQEIANLTKIPRSSVYETLKLLEQKGLIERVIGENFIRVRAYPLDTYRQQLEEEISELKKKKSELAEIEKALSSPLSPTKDSVVIRYYRGVAGARQLFWNSLKTKDMIYVISSFGRSQFVGKKFYASFVSESFERGINERVITNPTERAIGLIKRDAGTELARTDGSNVRFLTEQQALINGDTLMYDNVYAHLYFEGKEINGFEIESEHFVVTQRAIFDFLWQTAKTSETYL